MAETKILSQEAHSQLVKRERRANNVWNKLRRNKTAMIGLVIVVFMMAMAILAPMIATHDPNAIKPSETYLGFGEKGHIFGTDEFGRDLFSRIVYGARISLIAAIGGTFVGGIIGILLGLIAGYAGGKTDMIMMRIVDIIYSVPSMLYIVLIMLWLGAGVTSIMIGISITCWIGMARIVRQEVKSLKEQEFTMAAYVLGASPKRILLKHLLVNAMGPIIVNVTLQVPQAIFTEAWLSFLGVGISAPKASWGTLCEAARELIQVYPMQTIYPLVAICITIISFNFVGEGLERALDPKRKR